MEETKNTKKGKLLYTLLGVTLLLALVGGAYAFFSASVSNNSIGGQTQNINNDSLTLTVKKVVFAGVAAPTNDLVPAYFGLDGNDGSFEHPYRLYLS